MKWEQIPLGPLQTNSYILSNDSRECLVFDPGSEGGKLNKHLENNGLTPLAILLTHAHFDHIGAVDEVRDKWNIPVYIHKNEEGWLEDPEQNGSAYFALAEAITARKADRIIDGEGQLEIGPFTMDIYETPGHSPGSVSYYFRDEAVVFAGDALFAGSIGRTDLPGGNHDQLIQSIHDRLLTLPEETVVAPGHGPETNVQNEMDSNPFLNGF